MHLLDTTFLIGCVKNKHEFKETLYEFRKNPIYISSINSAELLSGAEKEDIERINEFLDSFIVIPVSDDLARKAGITRAELAKQNYKKPLPDVLIAQTAIEHNLILVTGNPKDFPQLAKRKLLIPFPKH